MRFTFFKEPVIMPASFTGYHTIDDACTHEKPDAIGVLSSFASIVPLLLFGGHSTGHSPGSTVTFPMR
jgi:hypothetical protein